MQDINGHGVSLRQNDQVYCRHSHKTGDDWIKEIRKMLYNSEK